MSRIFISRLIFLVLLAITMFPTIGQAQVPNPVSFNTAVNANLNGTIPLGANDLSWTTSSTSINGPYVAAVRASNQAAWLTSPFPTANWISYPFTCNLNPVNHSCIGIVDVYFQLTFTLPPIACGNSVNANGGYCLTMNYFADNWVNEIFVNGISSFSNSTTNNPYWENGFSAGTGATVTLCNNWQPGTNTLQVHIQSGIPTIGFLAFITATATTPGGYSVATTQSNISCFGSNNGSATVSLPGYSGPASYTWLPSGGNASTAVNLSPGNYSVNVQLPLCNFTNTISVTQPSSFAVNVTTSQPICKGSKITFTASGAESYSWIPGIQNGPIVTFTPTGSTNYTVIGTDAIGCKSATAFSVQVLTCAGIENETNEGISCYQNANNRLVVKAPIDQSCLLRITDNQGKQVYSKEFTSISEVQLDPLRSGVYLIEMFYHNSLLRKKIIISE